MILLKKIKALGSGNVNATLQATPLIDGSLDNTIHTHEYNTLASLTVLIGGTSKCKLACRITKKWVRDGVIGIALMITQNWTNSSVTGDHIRAIGNYAIGLV
jgi:hypothetical protein